MKFMDKRYIIEKKIGEGGMGEVFLAKDTIIPSRKVAIKTIKETYLKLIPDMLNEYEIMRRLWHPYIAKIYSFGKFSNGTYFLAMEYIEGQNLNVFLNKEKSVKAKIQIFLDILYAVDFIHSRNVIYNDIKPQNIIINKDKKIKLIDFGLSNYSDKSDLRIKGTIRYLAPEVIDKYQRDIKSDIFSLGVLFYEILTSKSYYSNPSYSNILTTLSNDKKYFYNVDIALNSIKNENFKNIIKKMCAFKKSNRYSSCHEIILEIEKFVNFKPKKDNKDISDAFMTGVPFSGRKSEVNNIIEFIKQEECPLLLISGNKGIGKTHLLEKVATYCHLHFINVINSYCEDGKTYSMMIDILNSVLIHKKDLSEKEKKYISYILSDNPNIKNLKKKSVTNFEQFKYLLTEVIGSLIIDFSMHLKNKVIITVDNIHTADIFSMDILLGVLHKVSLNKNKKLKFIISYKTPVNKNFKNFFGNLKSKDIKYKIQKLGNFTEEDIEAYLYNMFGKNFTHNSLIESTYELRSHSGGNPLFLQELLKFMFKEKYFVRSSDSKLWKLAKNIDNINLDFNIYDIVKKRLNDLYLEAKDKMFLIFVLLSRKGKYPLHILYNIASSDFDIHNKKIFNTMLKNEFFFIDRKGYFCPSNKSVIKILMEKIHEEDKITLHKKWIKILERHSSIKTTEITKIKSKILKDLLHSYLRINSGTMLLFENNIVNIVLEIVEREKAKYDHKKALWHIKNYLKNVSKSPYNNTKTAKVTYNKILLKYALLLENMGKWHKSINIYQKIIDINKKSPQLDILIPSMNYLGYMYQMISELNESEKILMQAKKLAYQNNKKEYLASIYKDIGSIYARRLENNKALKNYNKSYSLYKISNDKRGMSYALNNIGNIYSQEKKYEKADIYLKKALTISQEYKDPKDIAMALNNIAVNKQENGEYSQAIKYYAQCVKLCQESHEKSLVVIIYGNIANIYSDLGINDKALKFFTKSISIGQYLGNKENVCLGYKNMSSHYLGIELYSKALEYINKSLTIAIEINIPDLLQEVLYDKAYLLFESNNQKEALEILETSFKNPQDELCIDIFLKSEILEKTIKRNINGLLDLLPDIDLENKAFIYYHLWIMTNEKSYQIEAINIYKDLHSKYPKITYEKRIKKLNHKN